MLPVSNQSTISMCTFLALANHSRCIDAVAKADTAEGGYEGTTKTFSATKRNHSGRGARADDEDDTHYEAEGIAADDEEY